MSMFSYRKNYSLFAWITCLVVVSGLKPDLTHMNLHETVQRIEKLEAKHYSSCAYSRRVKRHDHATFPSSRPSGSRFGTALRFFGKETIQFAKQRYITPREFTIDFWMKPEGGQQSSVSVLGLFDHCSTQITDRGWRIGLQEAGAEKNLRVFFSLRAARSKTGSTLLSPLKVEPNVWIHVAATYNGKQMKLYINQAKVAVSTDQKGHVFAKALVQDRCEALEAGGDAKSSLYFRGTIDEVKLWSIAKSHRSISQSVFRKKVVNSNGLILYEGFNTDPQGKFQDSWVAITKSFPEIVKSTIPSDAHILSITKPPCGITVCDNPEVIRSYVNNTHLRVPKILRLRIINVMEDDGRNPIVTREQIQRQARVINDTFRRYDISWELHEVSVRNTSLRRRTVLSMCSPSMVGNMECNSQCDFPITGRDGGDCLKGVQSKCDPSKRGNGKCDAECNRRQHGWDYGDCCDPKLTETHKTCFDPASPYRAYMSIREYKTLLNFTNHRYLNVYFAQCGGDRCRDMVRGLATFPWGKHTHGVLGGVSVKPSFFGKKGTTNDLIHELGHVLGLWHVFHGVSKTEMKCTDECYEHFPSMELGDLCSDTNPTPMNNKCRDPSPKNLEGVCGRRTFTNTPFRNYMSYSNDACTNTFTPQQTARMHCYIDLIFQSWQPQNTTPSFIPLPPRVTSESPAGKVTIAWIPPLGNGGENAKNMCHYCRENSVLHQYAVTASSPMPDNPNGYWASHQAIGAPDVDPCALSPNAWTLLEKPSSCTNCYIELGFKEAVVPSSLSIWVNWHSSNGISDIQLGHEDSTFQSLGNATAQCDTPLTMAIKTQKKVSKVRIYLRNTYTSIDAVQLTSSLLHRTCLPCKPLQYHVTRIPAFTNDDTVIVSDTKFTDETVKSGVSYQYTVQAVTSSGLKGSPSPILNYTPKRGFCGDGRVDKETGEECDDGNVRDGDGCNVQCKNEDVFHCKGHPSLCYRHDGDGICEDFERRTSIKDCGFFTPEGFEDQWAHNATGNPDYQDEECPEGVVTGPPVRSLVCKPDEDYEISWSPCGHGYSDENYWLDVSFKQPVVPAAVILYIASDGLTTYSEYQDTTVEVELVDAAGRRHQSGSKSVKLSCKTNPAIVPIRHDMTTPFYYTQKVRIKFKLFTIAIAGVALRSLTKVDPVAIEACGPDELFNPRTRKCHKYLCNKPYCKALKIASATVKCEGNAEGQQCIATCAQGYRPSMPFKLLCLSGKWKGLRSCKPVDCGPPKTPNAKPDCQKGYSFGSTCTFQCITNAKLNGKDTSITCEDDGKWSVQRAFCVKTCAQPVIPLNSVAIPSSHRCIGGKDKRFFPGMACKYRCKDGTKLQTNNYSPVRITLKVHCTKEGTWVSSSRCVPVTCPLPPPYVLHWYNCTNGDAPGSVCTFSCPQEKPLQITCGSNGHWDRKFAKCKTAKSCDKPVTPHVTYTCDDLGVLGVCKAKCVNPNYDAVVKGDEDKWNVAVTCTSKLTWFPDPGMMVCMEKCRTKYLSDGWCDERHNNQHCRWDGGDCCTSTSTDGVVRRMPEYCGAACDCKDPNAKENILKPTNEPGVSGDSESPLPDDEDDDDDDYGGGGDMNRGENRAQKILRFTTKQ